MNKLWTPLVARYAVLSQREKVLIWIAVIALIAFPAYLWGIEPQLNALNSLEKKISEAKPQIESTQNLTLAAQAKLQRDPNKQLKQQKEALDRQLAKIDQALTDEQAGLISVKRMAGVLEQLLRQAEGLALVEMVSLQPEPVMMTDESSDHGIDFYRQGIRLTLDGSYFNLLNYLNSIEGLPDRFLWRVMNYRVDKHPKARVTLELYSLGSSKDFISG